MFLTFNFKKFNFFIYNNPLEQFDIFQINFLINNILFFFIIFNLLICVILYFDIINEIKQSEWNVFKIIYFQIYTFTKALLIANILLTKQFFFIFYFFIFIFILGANLIGLVPYSFTITSSFIITFSFAIIALTLINILAIYKNGFHRFIGFFLPSGTPFSIAILLVFIEIVSYIARLFSLSIRLFANMMAGHTLLKILIGFSFSILFTFSIFSSFSIFPWIIVSCIVVLEILIALLQAYVFLILICIYCNDVLQLH